MSSRRLPTAVVLLCSFLSAIGAFAFIGCKHRVEAPVTISFLDPEWSGDRARNRSKLFEDTLQEFTRQSGIQVKLIPLPEDTRAQLNLIQKLLAQGSSAPDVYVVDIVWPGILSKDLLDLNGQFPEITKSEDPELLNNYLVNGRLVGVPFHTNVGVLYYRADLLRKYGFSNPPKTWDELEKMALRIQTGERRAGNTNFWGYVWPGTSSDALTCNGVEWQSSEGGGRIVEDNRTISVNNPGTIKAWKRAAHWIGWISPPSVTAYREWDTTNAFKSEARSAFLRTWTSDYFLSRPPPPYPHFSDSGITSLPGPAVLGGNGLAVSRSSAHQKEALQLVRFLLNREHQLEIQRANTPPPQGPKFYNLPRVLTAYSHIDPAEGGKIGRVIARPSTILGDKYEQVSLAYSEAVVSVLTKRQTAEQAVAQLQTSLEHITGFPGGHVSAGSTPK